MKKMFQSAIMAFIILCGLQLTGCNPSEGNSPSNSKTELWPAKGSNGKWGYINKKGSFVIQPNYSDAGIFSCGYAWVQLNGTSMYIDTDGKIQYTASNDNYLEPFVNNYAVVYENNSRAGILDKNFNYVVQPIYNHLKDFVATNGLIAFQYSSGEKYGFIDVKTGKVAIQPQYDNVSYPFHGDYAVVRQNYKCGIINKAGEYTVQPVYNSIWPLGKDLFVCEKETLTYDRLGIMDGKGNIIVNEIYSNIQSGYTDYGYIPLGNLIAVRNNNDKYGYIDLNGKEIIPFQYDYAYPFVEGYAVVELNNREMIINQTGDVVFLLDESEYTDDDISDYYGFINGLILTYKNGSYRYRDTEGNIVYMWND